MNVRTENRVITDMRLPDTITASEYDLDLIVTLDPDFTIDGYFAMRGSAQIIQGTATDIAFHFQDMTINENSLTLRELDGQGSVLQIDIIKLDFERNIMTLTYEEPSDLSGGNFEYEVAAKYDGQILDPNVVGQAGFYRDYYYDATTGEQVWLAITQFETKDARRAFPCLDEPGSKAIYNVRLGHNDSLVAQSNGELITTGAPVEGYPNYVWSEFAQTNVMSAYLVAFAVSDFASVQSDPQPNGLVHIAWARDDAVADGLAEYVKEVGPACIEAYETVFNVPYAINKLEQHAPPSKGGAMENWGLIMYSETGLLINVNTSSASQWLAMVSVQAHEIAHQWFGNLVTCDWWTYLWLNEGFATYVSYWGSEYVAPEFHNFERFVCDDLFGALHADDRASSHEISSEIYNPDDTYFGSITYDKGASLIRMVESFITTDSWRKGLNSYLTKFAFQGAIPDNLFYEWDVAAKSDGTLANDKYVKTIMDTWTLQKNYPVVTVDRDYDQDIAILRQERFLEEPDETGDNHVYKWWIPITHTVVNDSSTDFEDVFNYDVWFPADAEFIAVATGASDKAVIFNKKFTAFYRTNYDLTNWDMLAQELMADHTQIHLNNRAQLIDDSYNLAKGGYLQDYKVAESIVEYLVNEVNYVPLEMAREALRDISSFNQGNQTSALRQSLENTFNAQYDRVGINEDPEGTWDYNMGQRSIVTEVCRRDDTACTTDSIAAYANYMTVPNPDNIEANPINRHVRAYVYCAALRNGGDAEYQFLRSRQAVCRDPQERSNINYGLGCYSNVDQLVQHLIHLNQFTGDYELEETALALSDNPNLDKAIGKVMDQVELNEETFTLFAMSLTGAGYSQERSNLLTYLSVCQVEAKGGNSWQMKEALVNMKEMCDRGCN